MKKLYMKRLCLGILLALTLLLAAGCAARETAFAPFTKEMLSDYPAGASKKVQGSEGMDGFRLAAQNNALRLYFNDRTAETAVEDIATGVIYRSNPVDFTAGPAGSQLLLTVYNRQGVRFTWDSCTQAVAFGQFGAEELPSGMDVTYVFGKTEAVYAVPGAVVAGTFEQSILPMLQGSSGATFVKLLYSKISLAAVTSPQQRQSLLERFPSLETLDLYVLKNNASRLEMEKAEKALTGAGYTMERKLADELEAGFAAQTEEQVHVRVKLRYELTDTGLRVTVPAGEIAVGGGASVTDVTVLPYFGSPGAQRLGFALVPDGMGALMDFSIPQDDLYPAFEARVYGRDYANLVTDSTWEGNQVYLPVFGVHQGSGALAGVVQSGASYASIVADAPRVGGGYGYCAAKFLLQESVYYSLDAKPENRVMVFQHKANREDLSIDYRFLPGEDVTYSRMAVAIREELLREGVLPTQHNGGNMNLPLVLSAVGAIDVTELVMGIPVNVVRPLSTYEQMGEMAARLKDSSGAKGMNLLVAGGSAGGLRTTRDLSFSPEKKLGGNDGFLNLQKTTAQRNISLSLLLNGQQVYKDTWLDSFHSSNDTARLLTSAVAYKPEYTLSTMYQDAKGLSAYLMNLSAIQKTVDSFTKSAKMRGVSSFALYTLGRDLYSDQNRNGFVSREEMKNALADLMEGEALSGAAFLSEGANSYLLRCLSVAYGLPLHASPHPLLNQEVPLLQMVLSGHVSYAATDVNYAADKDDYLLRLAETGSGLYMQAFYAPGSAVKYTDFDSLYASSFATSYERAAEIYKKAEAVLAPVYGKEIVCHERRGDIVRTAYEGGGAVYVNYGSDDVQVDWDGAVFLLPGKSALYRKEVKTCAVVN